MELKFTKPISHINTPEEIEKAGYFLTYNTKITIEKCCTILSNKTQNPVLSAEIKTKCRRKTEFADNSNASMTLLQNGSI